MKFEKARWIWVDKEQNPDTYGEFYTEFNSKAKTTKCLISCDSDYTLFINGNYVASNQYGDFEWYKSYDEIDITSYLKDGVNSIGILTWYFGTSTQRYLKANAGLIFEIFEDGISVCESNENVVSRYSLTYVNGRKKFITNQLGYGFAYDSTKEDDWKTTGKGLTTSVFAEKNCNFVSRPIEKLILLNRAESKVIESENCRYLIDLGKETVGLPQLEFESDKKQTITVAWGESLDGNHVRKNIDIRDFSFEYVAKVGLNEYANYMLRIGCRYIEVFSEYPIKINYIGVIPQIFPVKVKEFKLENELDQKIYDASVETLKNCMMEHYVDTPWREQCLYAYDSRNQILCGYYAFDGGNSEYAKANLKLIGQDRRSDDLLSICSPCGADLTIPSFSLYYFIALKEYLDFTDDKELIIDLYPHLLQILNVFLRNRENGLALKFEGRSHWNFYDWTDYLSSQPFREEKHVPDAMINILLIIALKGFKTVCEKIGKPFEYEEILNESIVNTKQAFFRKEKGLFEFTVGGGEFTVLVNALAVVAGLTNQSESEVICEKIENGEILDCTLSMKFFKYDAMLKTDKERWSSWVLSEIRREYGKMVESGSSCVWETAEGSVAFDNAGSLCHGWSSVPVYYYQLLSGKNL